MFVYGGSNVRGPRASSASCQDSIARRRALPWEPRISGSLQGIINRQCQCTCCLCWTSMRQIEAQPRFCVLRFQLPHSRRIVSTCTTGPGMVNVVPMNQTPWASCVSMNSRIRWRDAFDQPLIWPRAGGIGLPLWLPRGVFRATPRWKISTVQCWGLFVVFIRSFDGLSQLLRGWGDGPFLCPLHHPALNSTVDR